MTAKPAPETPLLSLPGMVEAERTCEVVQAIPCPVMALPVNAPTTPMELLSMAVAGGADLDKLERLMGLQERWQAAESKKAFGAAMARAQSDMRRVVADGNNPQTHSKYATYAAIDRALRPIYSREGFALSFDTADSPQADCIRVICRVSHASGHTEEFRVDMPADGKGAKGGDVMTKTHATGSAMTYGMRYLVKMIFNVAVGEDDNDGNGASSVDMPEDVFQAHIAAIKAAKTLDELQSLFAVAYKGTKDMPTRKALIAAKDNRKAELGSAK
jgi:hypothetical protein